ncbi:MAG TPA: hypothetical protein VNY27_12160 [Solirubrobacteraceae bacterium]|jgi:hypothetical protein|nr:hypothetical protein [Solirubrobacteraceae bacterium]
MGSENLRRWPARIEYSAAIRVPATCFLDSDLQDGATATNGTSGLPLMRSGQFSSVFHVATAATPFAIKCFVRNQTGREERSRWLSHVLGSQARDWYVPFDFQDPGIRVDGGEFPIVKMQWIDGASLDEYIADHLGDSQQLITLAQRFRSIVDDLGRCGWAHGDLQHGNILVLADGRLKLVDYDGMYVPQLAGTPSREAGHPNYQHPSRISGQLDLYGPEMDRYAAWVIYGSILLCAHDPESWERYDGGDDKLLLSAADLRDPLRSPALLAWSESDHKSLRQIATALTATLTKLADATPALRQLQAEEPILEARPGQTPAAGRPEGVSGIAANRGRQSKLRVRLDEQTVRRRDVLTATREASEQARRNASRQATREASEQARRAAEARAKRERRRKEMPARALLAVGVCLALIIGFVLRGGHSSNPKPSSQSASPTAPSPAPTPPLPVPAVSEIRHLLTAYAHDVTVHGHTTSLASDFVYQSTSPREEAVSAIPEASAHLRLVPRIHTASIRRGPGWATARVRLDWVCPRPSASCVEFVSHARFRIVAASDGSLQLEKVLEDNDRLEEFTVSSCPCTVRIVETVKNHGRRVVVAAGNFHSTTPYPNYGFDVPLTPAGRSLITDGTHISVTATWGNGSVERFSRKGENDAAQSLWNGASLRVISPR